MIIYLYFTKIFRSRKNIKIISNATCKQKTGKLSIKFDTIQYKLSLK